MTEHETTPAPEAPDTGWTGQLPPELRQLVETKGYRSPADVVQAYAHAQRAIGAGKIPLPRDGVWDEVARERLGIPPEPAGYPLARPEMPEGVSWDDAFEKAALPVAHKLGLTPHQVQGLMDFYAGHQAETFATVGRTRNDAETRASDALRNEWGPDYGMKLSQAARAARYFGGEDLVSFLNESGAGNNPHLIRAFARAGASLAEDTLKGDAGPVQGLAPGDAIRKARELMAKPAYVKRDHPEHFDLVEQVRTMFERAYMSNGD
ncbi:MAG: hypothetical protein RJA21_585 [Gemmatimonadota bacterium]